MELPFIRSSSRQFGYLVPVLECLLSGYNPDSQFLLSTSYFCCRNLLAVVASHSRIQRSISGEEAIGVFILLQTNGPTDTKSSFLGFRRILLLIFLQAFWCSLLSVYVSPVCVSPMKPLFRLFCISNNVSVTMSPAMEKREWYTELTRRTAHVLLLPGGNYWVFKDPASSRAASML